MRSMKSQRVIEEMVPKVGKVLIFGGGASAIYHPPTMTRRDTDTQSQSQLILRLNLNMTTFCTAEHNKHYRTLIPGLFDPVLPLA